MNNEFKFWCPVDIKKAVDDKTGEDIMLLGGIASTADEDSDGEFLDPKGFDIKPLIEKGLVNWHHQAKTNPGTIVGEPTVAEIRKDGLYIETKLYPSSSVAVDIWNLAKTLEADSKTRRLGYSIEGKVIERKSDNPSSPDYKKITKAIITGVAITHMPKNPKTFASIIKGEIDDISDEEPEEEEVKTTKEPISSKDENVDEEQKDLDTESGAALKKESVDGEVKVNTFSKSEVFESLFKDIPGIEIEKAEEIYLLIHNISSMAKKKSITNEDIVKAYDALGLDASESLIAKADAETEDTEREEEETEDTDVDEEEADKPEDEATVDETDDEQSEEEETEKKSLKKGNLFGRFDKIEKAVAVSHLNQTKYIKALGTMVKAQSENLEKAIDSLKLANDKIDEQSEIIKGYENEIAELSERLEKYGSGGAAPRSIRHAQAVERNFDKGVEDDINKGGNDAGNRVSIKNHSAVAEILDQATFAKGGYDDEFSKACMHFEATKDLPANIISRIKSEFGVEIVK